MNSQRRSYFALLTACLGALLGEPAAALAQAKPNVIVFMADDMGIGDTSAYLNQKLEQGAAPIAKTIRTPNLERLAAMGTTFLDAHSPSSMCSTTRIGLLTGRYAWRSNTNRLVIPSGWTSPPAIDEQRATIADMFKGAGYDTAAIGKWHVGVTMADRNGNPYWGSGNNPSETEFNNVNWRTTTNPTITGPSILYGPTDNGFDYYYGLLSNNESFVGNVLAYVENRDVQGTLEWTPGTGIFGGPTTVGWDYSKVGESYLNKTLGLIDAHAGVGGGTASDNPLFVYYAATANHSLYAPPTTMNVQGTQVPIAGQAKYTDGTDADVRADTVHENDVAVGALLDKLENTIDPQTGGRMIDNTIFIFTSDNGSDVASSLSTGGLKDKKRSIYEGGHRVPFLAAWGGQIPQGAVSNATLGLNDLYATLAAVTGQSLGPEQAEDSENVLPALLGQAGFSRPSGLILHDDSYSNDVVDGPALAIRSGDMKLIVSRDLVNPPTAGGGQAIAVGLYNLATDPQETQNLLNNPTYASLVTDLTQQLLQARNQGFSRSNLAGGYGPLFASDGGADLIGSFTGSVGFEFTVGSQPAAITRLGMWDDAAADFTFQETNRFNPDGDTAGAPNGLAQPHMLRLFDATTGQQIASIQITNANSVVEGEFRYVQLPSSVLLKPDTKYALTMSTTLNDADFYHTFAPNTGNAPAVTSLIGDLQARVSTTDGAYPNMLPTTTPSPVTGAAGEQYYAHRLLLGPTATLAAPNPLLSDFNGNGSVGGEDLLIWQRNLGLASGATRAQGDASGDGKVDAFDLTLWQLAFSGGSAAAAQNLLTTAVPEPTTLGAGTLAAFVLALRRTRSRRTTASRLTSRTESGCELPAADSSFAARCV